MSEAASQVVLITGTSSGIGLAAAAVLAKAGFKVALPPQEDNSLPASGRYAQMFDTFRQGFVRATRSSS